MKNPLVSIVVISYNSAKYVVQTLESAKAQDYKNIELIISDDGSTDGTVRICADWLATNKQHFVNSKILVSKQNTGISPNCNRGFDAAQGEWIKSIAADDILLPHCISTFVEYSANNPERKILFSKIQVLGTSSPLSTDLSSHHSEYWEKAYSVFTQNTIAHRQYQILLNYNFCPAASLFINKKAWIDIGKFDEEIRLLEDYPFWLNATAKGYALTLLPATTVGYRAHEGSAQIVLKNKFSMAYTLFGYKYINKLPPRLFSFFVAQIHQLESPETLRNRFFMYLLYTLKRGRMFLHR